MLRYDDKGLYYPGPKGTDFVSWEEIDRERNKIRFADHVLVTLTQGYARDDYVDTFIMPKDEWAEIKAKMLEHGEVYIGEIAGKHSEVVFYPTGKNAIREEFDLEKIAKFFAVSGWGHEDMEVRERLEEALEEY